MFYVLAATRALLRSDGAFANAARAQSRRPPRPRRARHRRRRRAPRPDEPRVRRAGTRTPARRPRASRRARAVRGGGPRRAPRDRVRPRLRRGSAAQCRRPARRHVDRHPLPARRHRTPRRWRWRGTRPAEPRAARSRGDDAGRSARRPRRRSRTSRPRSVHGVPVSTRMAPGRGRHRRVAAQGPLPPSGDRVRARGATASCAARAARSPGFHLRDALDLVAKRAPGTITRFGGHAFAAGLTLPEDALPAFRDAFEAVGARTAHAGASSRGPARATAASRAAKLTFDLARDAARPRVGAGHAARPTFDDTFDVRAHADRRRQAHAAHPRARRRALRGDPVRARRPAPGAASTPPTAPTSTNGRATPALELTIEHWLPAPEMRSLEFRASGWSRRKSERPHPVRDRIATFREHDSRTVDSRRDGIEPIVTQVLISIV